MNKNPQYLTHIETLIATDDLSNALAELDNYISENPDDSKALYLRGKIHWKMGHRSEAQNDYLASSDLDPDGPAASALEIARDIEAFFNPDLLNP